ncbi:hypothetical protein BJ742DRAFT_224793 [Cladochytrium replicatum]|nr:hypothetical protein BJ742DRAFT_224793 [Cladochytrium replicatum]
MLVSGLLSDNTSLVTELGVPGESVPSTPKLSGRATLEKRFGDTFIELVAANPELEFFSLNWLISLDPILKACTSTVHCLRRLRIGSAMIERTPICRACRCLRLTVLRIRRVAPQLWGRRVSLAPDPNLVVLNIPIVATSRSNDSHPRVPISAILTLSAATSFPLRISSSRATPHASNHAIPWCA